MNDIDLERRLGLIEASVREVGKEIATQFSDLKADMRSFQVRLAEIEVFRQKVEVRHATVDGIAEGRRQVSEGMRKRDLLIIGVVQFLVTLGVTVGIAVFVR